MLKFIASHLRSFRSFAIQAIQEEGIIPLALLVILFIPFALLSLPIIPFILLNHWSKSWFGGHSDEM